MRNGRYTAMLVDDEKWTRDVLRCVGHWEELGIEIAAEASDGDYALELALQLCPDIILSDVKMPNMDGLAFLAALRESGCRTRVIFVSGYDDFSFVRSALQLSAVDYLLKPVKPEELNRQLKRCVEELKQEEAKLAEQKQEERAQEQAAPPLSLDDVFQAEWFDPYQVLRRKIYEAFWAKNAEKLDRRFEELEKLVPEAEGGLPSRAASVYLYCDLYNLLSEILAKSGYARGEVWKEQEKMYVFGQDFSFHEMLGSMRKLFQKTLDRMEELRQEKHRLDLTAVKRYVDAHYSEDITLEETADRFFVSREYLSKVFKAETGTGFSGYVTDLRMKKARQLLDEGVAIKEIAEMLGYKEIGHFYKMFKKYYGVTPGQMLREIKS